MLPPKHLLRYRLYFLAWCTSPTHLTSQPRDNHSKSVGSLHVMHVHSPSAFTHVPIQPIQRVRSRPADPIGHAPALYVSEEHEALQDLAGHTTSQNCNLCLGHVNARLNSRADEPGWPNGSGELKHTLSSNLSNPDRSSPKFSCLSAGAAASPAGANFTCSAPYVPIPITPPWAEASSSTNAVILSNECIWYSGEREREIALRPFSQPGL